MAEIIVVCGVPGSGKTHHIQERYVPQYPVLDIQILREEVRRESEIKLQSFTEWTLAMNLLFKYIADISAAEIVPEAIVIEGIFAPGSRSRNWLRSKLQPNFDIRFERIMRPAKTCAQSILDDFRYNDDESLMLIRLKLLAEYYDLFVNGKYLASELEFSTKD